MPTTIPGAGTSVNVSVAATTSKNEFGQHVRFVPSMTISGGLVKGGSVTLSADSNSETAPSKTTPGTVELTTGNGTFAVTVQMSDGPKYTYTYRDEEPPPPCSVAARFSAEGDAAAENCQLGKLPVNKNVKVNSPEPGKTTNISPTAIPPETYKLILEILAEQEAERLAAALAAKFGAKEANDLIAGCFFVIQGGFEEEVTVGYDLDNLTTKKVTSREGKVAIYNACARLLLSGGTPAQAPRGADVAATGCRVITVPVFERGTKVTKRRRKQARAAILEQVKPSCDDKRKGFTASLNARGKGATLNDATGRNIGAPLARMSDTPANGRRVSVRWTARKR